MKRWTPAEDSAIRNRYGTDTSNEIARRLGRTPLAVRLRAQKIGVAMGETYYWTQQQDAKIKLAADVRDMRIIRAIARQRGCKTSRVLERAREIGVGWRESTGFSPREDVVIKNRYRGEGSKIFECLDSRTPEQIRKRARRLGIKNRPRHPELTTDQTAFLRRHYDDMPIREICDRLGLSEYVVRTRINKIGLTRKTETLNRAARRLRVGNRFVRTALRNAGQLREPRHRYDPKVIDAAVRR